MIFIARWLCFEDCLRPLNVCVLPNVFAVGVQNGLWLFSTPRIVTHDFRTEALAPAMAASMTGTTSLIPSWTSRFSTTKERILTIPSASKVIYFMVARFASSRKRCDPLEPIPFQTRKTLFADQHPYQPGAFDIVVYYDAALQEGPRGLIKCPYLALRRDCRSETFSSFTEDEKPEIIGALQR